eukprot:22957_4
MEVCGIWKRRFFIWTETNFTWCMKPCTSVLFRMRLIRMRFRLRPCIRGGRFLITGPERKCTISLGRASCIEAIFPVN